VKAIEKIKSETEALRRVLPAGSSWAAHSLDEIEKAITELQDLESYLVEQIAYYADGFTGIISCERADAKAEAYQDILNKYRGEKC